MARSVWIALGIAGLAVLWVGSGLLFPAPSSQSDGLSQATGPEVPRVRVVDSRAQPMQAVITVHGQTEAKPNVLVRAETAGRVERIVVAKGATVRVGDVLVNLALKEREARLAEAKAQVDHRALEYRQASALARKDFASRTSVALAQANLQEAQAALTVIEQDIADTAIRAPFDGVFDENLVEIGDTVAVGAAIGRVVRLDPMTVIAEVSERYRDAVREKGAARVTLIDGRQVDGQVSWISRVANETTRTYRVELTIPNADRSIASGMTASVALSQKTQMAHLVTPAALTLDDAGQIGIKAVNDQGLVEFYPVQAGTDSPQGVWLQGLPPRVRIITVGQDYVAVGSRAEAVSDPTPQGVLELGHLGGGGVSHSDPTSTSPKAGDP